MMQKEKIEEIIKNEITGTEIFLVEVYIGKANKISVLLDTFDGITIQECGMISRAIENQLDREEEDFSLEVSSPGLNFPLKHFVQYQKNIGRELEIITSEEKKLKGILISVNKQGIVVESETKIKKEGKKKKEIIVEQVNLMFDIIKTTKVLPDFKRLKQM